MKTTGTAKPIMKTPWEPLPATNIGRKVIPGTAIRAVKEDTIKETEKKMNTDSSSVSISPSLSSSTVVAPTSTAPSVPPTSLVTTPHNATTVTESSLPLSSSFNQLIQQLDIVTAAVDAVSRTLQQHLVSPSTGGSSTVVTNSVPQLYCAVSVLQSIKTSFTAEYRQLTNIYNDSLTYRSLVSELTSTCYDLRKLDQEHVAQIEQLQRQLVSSDTPLTHPSCTANFSSTSLGPSSPTIDKATNTDDSSPTFNEKTTATITDNSPSVIITLQNEKRSLQNELEILQKEIMTVRSDNNFWRDRVQRQDRIIHSLQGIITSQNDAMESIQKSCQTIQVQQTLLKATKNQQEQRQRKHYTRTKGLDHPHGTTNEVPSSFTQDENEHEVDDDDGEEAEDAYDDDSNDKDGEEDHHTGRIDDTTDDNYAEADAPLKNRYHRHPSLRSSLSSVTAKDYSPLPPLSPLSERYVKTPTNDHRTDHADSNGTTKVNEEDEDEFAYENHVPNADNILLSGKRSTSFPSEGIQAGNDEDEDDHSYEHSYEDNEDHNRTNTANISQHDLYNDGIHEQNYLDQDYLPEENETEENGDHSSALAEKTNT